jgi:hypothetical protein
VEKTWLSKVDAGHEAHAKSYHVNPFGQGRAEANDECVLNWLGLDQDALSVLFFFGRSEKEPLSRIESRSLLIDLVQFLSLSLRELLPNVRAG